MENENTFENLRQLLDGAGLCLEHNLHLPSLVLIYCVVDIAGWLSSAKSRTRVKQSFTQWLDQYVLPNDNLPCTSLDLYAARCGLLHSNSPESRLTDRGEAKLLARIERRAGKAFASLTKELLDEYLFLTDEESSSTV